MDVHDKVDCRLHEFHKRAPLVPTQLFQRVRQRAFSDLPKQEQCPHSALTVLSQCPHSVFNSARMDFAVRKSKLYLIDF